VPQEQQDQSNPYPPNMWVLSAAASMQKIPLPNGDELVRSQFVVVPNRGMSIREFAYLYRLMGVSAAWSLEELRTQARQIGGTAMDKYDLGVSEADKSARDGPRRAEFQMERDHEEEARRRASRG